MSNSSICAIDMTLSDATTPSQGSPGNNGIEGVLHIPQSSSITGASPSGCLVSYTGHLLGGVTPLQRCRMLSVSSIAPANWAQIQ